MSAVATKQYWLNKSSRRKVEVVSINAALGLVTVAWADSTTGARKTYKREEFLRLFEPA